MASAKIPLWGLRGVVRAWAVVDADDFDWLSERRWHLAMPGYAADRYKRFMHRELLALVAGDGRYVDHINHDRLDNRRANLRIVSNAENMQNRSTRRFGTSRYRGVCWCPRTERWVAQAQVGGRSHFLGRYHSEEEAGRVAAEFRAREMPGVVPVG